MIYTINSILIIYYILNYNMFLLPCYRLSNLYCFVRFEVSRKNIHQFKWRHWNNFNLSSLLWPVRQNFFSCNLFRLYCHWLSLPNCGAKTIRQHAVLSITFQKTEFTGNTKGGSIIILLTSCLTGLESAVWQLTIFVFMFKTD